MKGPNTIRSIPPADSAGPNRALTTREAAAILDVDERTVRRAIAPGHLAAVRRGAAYRIAAAELERYAAGAERQGNAPRSPAKIVALPAPADGPNPPPRPLSSFVGRFDDVAAVRALLLDPDVRLLTLTGPGGIGKTRLALAAAAVVRDAFPDGVIFVGLAAVDRADKVAPEIGQALGLRETQDGEFRGRLRAYLRSKRRLLLLDNFEQVLGAAPLVAELAAGAPGVTVLVTSRAPLRVGGEREMPVPPLALPAAGGPVTPDALQASDAGRLFIERVREHDPAFAVDDLTAPMVAAVCARLDGLPLAIELAAARTKLLPPQAMLARLDPWLPLLTGGAHDAPARLRTMRNAIAWSYDLLSPPEQTLFRRLAVFVGGFTLAAAEGVGGQHDETEGGRPKTGEAPRSLRPPPPYVLDLVGSLLDQSLLGRELGPDGESRFRMLETVREYGLERLSAGGEVDAARSAHAQHVLAFAESFGQPAVLASHQRALDRIAADYANVSAALEWLDERGRVEDFVRLVGMLPGFWFAYSHYRAGRAWLERALVRGEQALPHDRARVLIGLARFHVLHGDYAEAEARFAVGVPLLRAHGDALETATALMWRGIMATFAGDDALAETALAESLALAEQVADPRWRTILTGNLRSNLGVVARARGDLDLAEERHEQSLRHFRAQGIELGVTGWYLDMGDLARDRGNVAHAVERYRTCLARIGEQGDVRIVVEALAGIASAATAWGHDRHAARLFGAAEALRERSGPAFVLPVDVAARVRAAGVLRAALGETEFAVAWAEGRALSRSEAEIVVAAVVAAGAPVPAIQEGTRGDLGGLSARELDVLRLLVARHSDREIAAALFLSPRTVHWYVANILGKLGVASRRQAAELAVAEGLV